MQTCAEHRLAANVFSGGPRPGLPPAPRPRDTSTLRTPLWAGVPAPAHWQVWRHRALRGSQPCGVWPLSHRFWLNLNAFSSLFASFPLNFRFSAELGVDHSFYGSCHQMPNSLSTLA